FRFYPTIYNLLSRTFGSMTILASTKVKIFGRGGASERAALAHALQARGRLHGRGDAGDAGSPGCGRSRVRPVAVRAVRHGRPGRCGHRLQPGRVGETARAGGTDHVLWRHGCARVANTGGLTPPSAYQVPGFGRVP